MLFVIVPLVLFVVLLLGLKTVKTSVEAFQEKAKLKRQDMDYANAHFPLVKEAFEALWTKDDYVTHSEAKVFLDAHSQDFEVARRMKAGGELLRLDEDIRENDYPQKSVYFLR